MSATKFPKKTLRKVPLDGKTVLLRADYSVPLDSNGQISDDYRIRQSLPTIQALLERNCKIVIVSHLGRPKGRDERYSLEPVAKRLSELLGQSVRFIDKVVGDKVRMSIKHSSRGSVTLLENVRFDSREKKNDAAFAAQLVKDTGAEYIVQDAFGVVHRAHASTAAAARYAPAVAGLLLEREYLAIKGAMMNPKRPLVAVVGGAKIKDKIGILRAFANTADTIIIGGAMANTFLAYRGHDMQASMVEPGQEDILEEIYSIADVKSGGKVDDFLVLPKDVVAAKNLDASKHRNVGVDRLKKGEKAFDVGERAIRKMRAIVRKSQMVLWNGTLGVAEYQPYRRGSAALAQVLAEGEQVSIIGGGDTVDFVRSWSSEADKEFTHVSTGGGAGLALMAGESMPGIDSLLDA